MRRFLFVLTILWFTWAGTAASASAYPEYSGFVNDFAGVIPAEQEAKITQVAGAVQQSTTAEIAVVTVASISPLTVEMYAVELFEKWGIGRKDKDNGVLILLAIKERVGRIETGYGLEGVLPDILCAKISRERMVPYFKKGAFGKGLFAGTVAVAGKVAEEYNVDLSKALKEAGAAEVGGVEGRGRSVIGTIFTLLLFILFFGMRMGLFGFLLLGRPGYWGRGGYAGTGGFGGGFGGFGGGLSGGGGASFNW